MPSLNTKREVKYTPADLRALEAALAIATFAKDFDPAIDAEKYSFTALALLVAHVKQQAARK